MKNQKFTPGTSLNSIVKPRQVVPPVGLKIYHCSIGFLMSLLNAINFLIQFWRQTETCSKDLT